MNASLIDKIFDFIILRFMYAAYCVSSIKHTVGKQKEKYSAI